ncbi:hypothetical protein [Microvirga alba]|uniref:Phosphate acetyl/butaryl transferase domain-containing protein n=1 Tax=Microvirga alba TaxID=2791025 RepID=A0A931BSY8_9HYPH|nr:hypothetical protein [Microvirga alba]MBF9235408.1 hypothetical protein [Microvirga alba]
MSLHASATEAAESLRRQERRHEKYERLVSVTLALPRLKVAVAHPCDVASLDAVMEAVEMGLIEPILVGPRDKIAAAAKDLGGDISALTIIDAPHSHASAHQAVGLVRAGKAEALMKGSLHTDELMSAVVQKEGGLRTARRIMTPARGRDHERS